MEGGSAFGRSVRVVRRVWCEPPDRLRVELLRDGAPTRVGVQDGGVWWRWDREEGETIGDATQGAPAPPLLDVPLLFPARLLSSMHLQPIGRGIRAGREVVKARGTLRHRSDLTERYAVFDFDQEHGTTLYTATFEGGKRTSSSEAIAVDYAPAWDRTLFTFKAPQHQDPPLSASARPRTTSPRQPRTSTPNKRSLSVPLAQLASHQTVWLTGVPGAGKSTIAAATEHLLHQLGARCCVLDGDEIRRGLSSDLGLTREDRREHARRVGHVATMVASSGAVAIVALVSPYAEDRQHAKELHDAAGIGFLEVWVNTRQEVCLARDPGGIYSAATPVLAGQSSPASDGSGVTGLTAPYEAPVAPDLCVSGEKEHPRVAAARIVEQLLSKSGRSQLLPLIDP